MSGIFNFVEALADPEDQEPCACKFGNVVIGHACYCHSDKSPFRKCPQWRAGEPYENCEFFEKADDVPLRKL